MYPPICHCLHFVLFPTPSVIISFISVPCGASLRMLGLGCGTKPCRDLVLRPCFVSVHRLRNAPFCALETAPPLLDSSTHGCTAQHADVKPSCALRRPSPLVHRRAMPSVSRQLHSPLRPLSASEWQPQNSTCTHRVFLRAPPQGIFLCLWLSGAEFVVHVSAEVWLALGVFQGEERTGIVRFW